MLCITRIYYNMQLGPPPGRASEPPRERSNNTQTTLLRKQTPGTEHTVAIMISLTMSEYMYGVRYMYLLVPRLAQIRYRQTCLSTVSFQNFMLVFAA